MTHPPASGPAPLLSIVVPVRNHRYALAMLRGVLALPDADIELVLHDASAETDLAETIARTVDDPRLRYHFVGQGLSLYRNFNAAATWPTGEYICFVGEDDGVSPQIVAAARWARANNLDAVRDTRRARYYWPDMGSSGALAQQSGRLFLDTRFTGAARLADVEAALHTLMRSGGQDYLALDLPKLYHGLVRRRCVEALRERTGETFKGLTPDIYAAVALTPFVQRVATVDYPLTIDGTASASNAGASARRGHRGLLQSSPHLSDRPDYPWPAPVPRFYSVETIWAESALVAAQAIGRDDLLAAFNQAELCARCLAAHPDYAHVLLPEVRRLTADAQDATRARLQVAGRWAPLQATNLARAGYRRARQALRLSADYIRTLEPLEDNAAAMHALGSELEKGGRSFASLVPERL